VRRLEAQDEPLHVREGEFASLYLGAGDDWVVQKAEEYGITGDGGSTNDTSKDEPKVNLYYSYLSVRRPRSSTRLSRSG